MTNINPLGQTIEYKTEYDRNILFPIEREKGRSNIGLGGIGEDLPFYGYDVWNCFEVSWLSPTGKPEVRIMEFYVPHDSSHIVESKSVKLYLYSMNNTKFASDKEMYDLIVKDLSEFTNSQVIVKMHKLDKIPYKKLVDFAALSIDNIHIEMDKYEINPAILKTTGKDAEEKLSSDLLRSNCLMTNQPDWASLMISYRGKQIDHKSLLEYIVSFRNHIEFHEQCVERIFTDIMRQCQPKELTVHAKYTRRGGIDINPIRSSRIIKHTDIDNSRLFRQ